MYLNHPFISKPRLAFFYIFAWVIIMAGNVLLRWLAYGINPGIAAVEFFAFPFMFSIIGIPIWYVIKYSTIENNSVGRIIISHIMAATIIVMIWLYLGLVIMKLLHPEFDNWSESGIPANVFFGYILYLFYVLFFYAVNYYQGFREKVSNESKLKELVKEAELHALKSQINPHFLFNSLNSISSLTLSDPGKAHEMVINLSSIMRYSFKHFQTDKVTLREEIKNNQFYLQIEKVRFGEKLNALFEIEERCLESKIPNMILQPLYENAIKYGVYEATEPVDIITRGTCMGDILEITITNNYDPNAVAKKGEGIGLRNIRDRLQIIYGNPMLMKVEDKKDKFIVTLSVPQK
jgi:hypothetical protein